MVAVTTDSVRPHERVEYWTDLVSRNVTPMHIEPDRHQPLRGEVRPRAIGDLTVAQVSGCGLRALHGRRQIAETVHHLVAACVHIEGEARINRRGERIELQRGDVFITDSREEFTLDLDRPWLHLVLSMPTQWIDGRVARPELLAGLVVRGHPLMGLWATYLADGFAMAGEFSPPAAAQFARNSVELLAQAIDELHREEPTPSDPWRGAMYERACQLIALRFGDASLRPDQIARELHVSTRTLSRIFAAHQETVMGHVLDQRIRRAMALLAAPAAAHRSITEIAFACGFNDSSHFGRVFAARLHATPSEWRRENR